MTQAYENIKRFSPRFYSLTFLDRLFELAQSQGSGFFDQSPTRVLPS